MDNLNRIYKKLLQETTSSFHRYLYDKINWDNRIIGICGPRGVGKTTMMLQHIKEELPKDEALYVNADDIYFSNNRLLDLAERLVQRGVYHLYIDEICVLGIRLLEYRYNGNEPSDDQYLLG